MDSMLQQTIETYARLALIRGCSSALPIRFSLVPDTTTQVEYILIASYGEPTFSEIPYNVLWLDMSGSSVSYKQILRRVSHISDGQHRGTWFKCDAYSDLYAEAQVYLTVVENASDLGLDVGDLTVGLATTTKMGRVLLESGTAAVGICSDDPRMDDERTPLPHESMHLDYARTLIKINQTQHAVVESAAPSAGSTLVLKAQSPTDSNIYTAEWRSLTVDDILWTSPKLESLIIELAGAASYMDSGTSADLLAKAVYTDHTENDPLGIVWSLSDNNLGIVIDQSTGVVTAPVIAYDIDLTVTAYLVDPVFNKTVTNTYVLRIVASIEDTVVGIEIVGTESYAFQFDFETAPVAQSGLYTVALVYASGAREAIVPDTFTHTEATAFTLSGYNLSVVPTFISTGVYQTFAANTLYASYQSYTAQLVVTYSATNTNAGTGGETGGETGGGTTTPFAKYTIAPAAIAYVDPDHRFDADTAPTTFSVFVLVDTDLVATQGLAGLRLVNGSQATEPEYNITANDYFIGDSKFVMSGATSMLSPMQTTPYGKFKMKVVNATSYVDAYLTSMLNSAAAYLITQNGLTGFTKAAVVARLVALVKANTAPTMFYIQSSYAVTGYDGLPLVAGIDYTVNGVQYTSTTSYTLTNSILPYAAAILCADTVAENQNTQLAVNLYYDNGTVRSAGSTEIQSWATDGTVAGTTITSDSMLHAGSVSVDTTTVLTAHVVTVEGIIFNPSKPIVVKQVLVTPIRANIVGNATLTESRSSTGTYTNTYSATVTLSDGTTVSTGLALGNWTATKVSGGVGLLTTGLVANGFTVSAGSGTANGVLRIAVPVTYEGVAFTPTLDVAVVDTGRVSSVSLIGTSSINEGGMSSYTMQVNYDDGSASTTLTSFALSATSGASYVTINNNSVTVLQVPADTAIVLRGSVTLDSKLWTADLNVVLKNVPVTPTAITINGAATVEEGKSTTYSVTATFSDGTQQTVTPNWSLDTAITGSSITAAGVYVSGAIAANTVQVLGATYTQNNVTVTATKSITVTNLAVVSTVKFGYTPTLTSDTQYNAYFLSLLTVPISASKPISAVTGLVDVTKSWLVNTTVDNGITGEWQFNCPENVTGGATVTASAPNGYSAYVAIPYDIYGYGYFRCIDPDTNGVNFVGSWDGARVYPADTSPELYTGGYLVTIDGVRWVIYRNDFPFEYMQYAFGFKTHASSASSGLA